MVNFKPKQKNWVNFGGSCNGRQCYMLWAFGLFYGYLVYFMSIWYIVWPFGIFYVDLVCFCQLEYFYIWSIFHVQGDAKEDEMH
jgi:hypothetical protein